MAETASQQLLDLWKKQMEDGTQAWLKMMGQGQPADPQAFWRPVHGPGHGRVVQGDDARATASPDLMAQWKQFVDQWIAAWSKVLEQAMGTESFAQAMGKQLEGFLNAGGACQEGGRATDGSRAVRARRPVA